MPVVRISEALFAEVQKYAEPLIDDFESTIWKILRSQGHQTSDKPIAQVPRGRAIHRTRSFAGTRQDQFRKPILEAVVELGGEASARKVCELVESKMKTRMKPADYEALKDGSPRWFKAVNFQRLWLTKKGFLDTNSPRGIWRITESGRQWLRVG